MNSPHTARSSRSLLASALAVALATTAFAQQEKPATPAAAKPETVATVALPSAATVLEKSVKAIGGTDAWTKIKSMEIKGSMDIPAAGIKGPMTARTISPNKMVTVMELPGFGTVRTGTDGTTAWSIDPSGGPRLLEGSEKDMLLRESEFLKDLQLAKHWDSIETVADGDFGGVACWKLAAKRGEQTATLWFEKESGLARGSEMVVDTQLGKIPVVSTITEYRPFGDVKIATRTETMQMGQKMVTAIDSVTFDAVSEKDLELPIEIKALLEPEPADEEDGEDAPPAKSTPETPAKSTTPAAPSKPATTP